jgi:hypothetical protein
VKMNSKDTRMMNESIEQLAIGIGRHLETLQGQIVDRFERIEKAHFESMTELNQLLEGKVKVR